MPTLEPTIRFANELDSQPVQWLWPLRIPRGSITLLVGDPGVGKSLLALDLAARVTAPHPWPAAAASQNPPIPDPARSSLFPSVPSAKSADAASPPALPHYGSVLLLAPEDHPTQVIIPRLRATRADLTRVALIAGLQEAQLPLSRLSPATRAIEQQASACAPSSLGGFVAPSLPLTLPQNADLLAMAVRSVAAPRLLIIDPLHAALSPAADAGGDALTQTLAALNDIAGTYGIAILAIIHLTKTPSRRVLYRVRGSLALSAAARSILMLSRDPDEQDRRILTTVKTVYGPPPSPLSFRIVSDSSCLPASLPSSPPQLSWSLDPTAPGTLSADICDLPDDAHSALADACRWLDDYLAHGPRPAVHLIAAARAAGHSLITLRRAKRALAVRSRKSRRKSLWLWILPEPVIEDDQLGVTQT